VIDVGDTFAALRPAERERLERFAARFERLNASSYTTLADPSDTDDAAVTAAKERAIEILGSGPRRDAVRAALRAFLDAAASAYSSRTTLTDTLLLFQSLPDRGEDRIRFLGSVERVLVALILWDDLVEDDRLALLGAWTEIVAPLAEA